MASWKDKLALTAQRNRRDIVKAKLSRRDMVRFGLLTTGGGPQHLSVVGTPQSCGMG